ncbi:MAG: C2 family cysteine protease [Aureispira sp.]
MVTILAQQLKTLIEAVNTWDKAYKKAGKEVSKDPKTLAQKKQLETLRASLINSVKEAHAKEQGEDNDFAQLEAQMKKMEAIRRKGNKILKTKDLKASMIFVSPTEYEQLDAFRSEYFIFQNLFQGSEITVQDLFGQITNEYDQRANQYYRNFEAIIKRLGILEGADSSTNDSPIEDEVNVVPTEEMKPPVEEADTVIEETLPETNSGSNSTIPVSDDSTRTTDLHSSDVTVQEWLQLQKSLVGVYNQAEAVYTPASQNAGEDLIVLNMAEHDQVYAFINQYEDFNWKFGKGETLAQQEFEQLTNNWAMATQQFFEQVQENITRIKITETHSTRLVNPKPTVNHNVVDQITGEDPKLGAVYQKTDRFVKNEEGRQYVQKEVKEEDLFKVGTDDKDSSGIDPYDIVQGALGNCYFMCSLSAIANSKGGPDKIKDMITANGDGTFSVKLYRPINKRSQEELQNNIKSTTVGFEAVEVVVDATIWYNKNDDSALYARSQDENEMWPLILEKAYAKLMGGYDEIDAGFSQEAYAVLTGTPRRSYEFSDNNEHAVKMIVQAAQEKKGVTLATPPNMAAEYALDEQGNNLKGNAGELIMITGKEDGAERIVAGHAYALDKLVGSIEIDSNGQLKGDAIIHLINPHGKNHIKKLPINSLQLYFSRAVVDY